MNALLSLAELLTGYPDAVYRRSGHPVVWVGALIRALERALNRGSEWRRTVGGLATVAVVTAAAVVVGGVFTRVLSAPLGQVLGALVAGSLIAQRSLAQHVGAVATGLEQGAMAAGREAVARIVGRDPEVLDVAGVSRAAIESLAETSRMPLSPPFLWMAVASLPGAAAYKAINTADSMMGHRSERPARSGGRRRGSTIW